MGFLNEYTKPVPTQYSICSKIASLVAAVVYDLGVAALWHGKFVLREDFSVAFSSEYGGSKSLGEGKYIWVVAEANLRTAFTEDDLKSRFHLVYSGISDEIVAHVHSEFLKQSESFRRLPGIFDDKAKFVFVGCSNELLSANKNHNLRLACELLGSTEKNHYLVEPFESMGAAKGRVHEASGQFVRGIVDAYERPN